MMSPCSFHALTVHEEKDGVNTINALNMEIHYFSIYRMLVINPGSTSTKISVFENRKNLFTDSIFHDAPELLAYKTVSDQLPMRRKVVMDFLAAHGIDINDIDVFIGRGGCAYSQKEGVMRIDRRLYEDTRDDKGGSDHPAKLGGLV